MKTLANRERFPSGSVLFSPTPTSLRGIWFVYLPDCFCNLDAPGNIQDLSILEVSCLSPVWTTFLCPETPRSLQLVILGLNS